MVVLEILQGLRSHVAQEDNVNSRKYLRDLDLTYKGLSGVMLLTGLDIPLDMQPLLCPEFFTHVGISKSRSLV